MSNAVSPSHVTREDFLRWAEAHPGRFERMDGRIVAMSPETSINGLVKRQVVRALDRAIAAAGLRCEAYPESMAVPIQPGDDDYVPDAFVRCGPRLPDEALTVPDPVIVVEVVSPSSWGNDLGRKLRGYFTVASVRHYLVVRPEWPQVFHFERDGGSFMPHILFAGPLRLDPPGIEVTVEEFYPPPAD